MISRFLLVIVICFLVSTTQSATPAPQSSPPAKQYFIAIFVRGPAWDGAKPYNEQIGFREHSENLRRLREEKRIPLGGRYADKGMVLVEAKSEDEARSMFASDVMVQKETFTLELHEFRPFFKGTIE